jgi:hypothetical protein
MIVEVNEENIALFALDKLTGNSVGELLAAAGRAEEEGYVLTCRVKPEDVLEHNVFSSFDAEPAKVELERKRRIEEVDLFSWGDSDPFRTIVVEVETEVEPEEEE